MLPTSKREVCGVLDFFLFFKKKLEKQNSQHIVFDAKP